MVVPVLMISCQVSEKPKKGPVSPQITITSTATVKPQALPRAFEVLRATMAKASRTRQKRSRVSCLLVDFRLFDFVAMALMNRLLAAERAHSPDFR
jgi:hypothetical protein